ncbi:hypothetical protein CEN47_21625 [Fischerella thermalis CCMEE 5319]|nr:hypothetical protein CEN47_21625 [Fischerella thermalis CCMEE 5319]
MTQINILLLQVRNYNWRFHILITSSLDAIATRCKNFTKATGMLHKSVGVEQSRPVAVMGNW